MSKGVMYVDNIRVEYDNEPNVLEVCRKAGVEIPNFCFHSDLSVYGACRMCMVEEEGTGKIDAACTMPPKNELHIRTNTARLLKYRRMIIELLLSAHCRDCTTCEKNRACRLQEMAVRFGIHHVRFDDTREHVKMDFSSPAVTIGPQQVHPLRRLCARLPRGAGRQQSALCRPWPKPAHRHGGQ